MDEVKFNFKDNSRITLLSTIASSFIWVLDQSYRVKKVNFKPELSPVIYAVWHGWQYGLLDIHPRKKVHLLVSKSTDGEIIGRVSKFLGYSLIRGSKGRDGVRALRRILRTLNNGGSVAYTVDGPRGPIHKVKNGIIKIAQMSQVPIVPLVPAAKWRTPAKSWDQYQIPHLCTKVVTVFGDPIYIPEELTPEDSENYRLQIENKLFELKDQAEILVNK